MTQILLSIPSLDFLKEKLWTLPRSMLINLGGQYSFDLPCKNIMQGNFSSRYVQNSQNTANLSYFGSKLQDLGEGR